jgi:hypothetical protein
VCETAEAKWNEVAKAGTEEELEDTVCFMLVAFTAGLRGEEVPLLSMEGLLTFWEESYTEEDCHIMLTLKGRFKGEVDERWHLVPVSNFARSGLPLHLWMERVLHCRVNLQKRNKGWLFQCRRGVRLKFGKYDATFRVLIDSAGENQEGLLPDVVETRDFSLWRLPRRGAVQEMTNQDVSEKVIELTNCWHKKKAAKGLKAGLSMRQVYTQARSTLPIMLKFSKAIWVGKAPFE